MPASDWQLILEFTEWSHLGGHISCFRREKFAFAKVLKAEISFSWTSSELLLFFFYSPCVNEYFVIGVHSVVCSWYAVQGCHYAVNSHLFGMVQNLIFIEVDSGLTLKFHRMCIRRRGKSLWSLDRTSFALGVKSTLLGFSLLLTMYFQFHQLPFLSLENVPNYWGTRAHRKRVNCHRSVGGWTRAALCPWHITPLQGKQPKVQLPIHTKSSATKNIIKVTRFLSEVAADSLGNVKSWYFQCWKEV